MITIRKAEDRGHANHGWLNTYHTFSFANYHNPKQMGFRALRVINEDSVSPGAGFGTHGHRDMEIITYVLKGALEHKDSLGTGSIIKPGEVQRMSAGVGITHSEFNHSQTEPVHFLQIWLLPEKNGLTASYEQRAFEHAKNPGKLHLVAAKDGREGAVTVHQDVDLYAAVLEPNQKVFHTLQPQRHAWIQVALGEVIVNGLPLIQGDGAAISEDNIVVEGTKDSEFLLFDLA